MHGELSLKQQTATPYVKKSNEEKGNLQIAHSEPETKNKFQKIQNNKYS